jgi:hypothetical protein
VSPSEPRTSNTLNAESSVSISRKRKKKSESEGSVIAFNGHCSVKPSYSMTLLKITQKVDAFEQRPTKRR